MSDLIERPDRLKLYRFGELVNLAPSPWLIKGVIRETSVACLFGPRGSCKSFVALSMAGSVATGLPWMGHPVLNSGLVIYVAAEGGGGMVQRARAWSEQHEIHPASVNMRFVTEPFVCASESDDMDVLVGRIRDAIDWQEADSPDLETGHISEEPLAREWPKLIIVDTVARCFHGDENSAEDMGRFIQGVDRLKMEFNCAVLVIHHSGYNPDHERGSTALGGACDTVYKLIAAAPPDPSLVLECTKMKDSREPEDLRMTRQEVMVRRHPSDDVDEDLSSLIVESELASKQSRKSHLLSLLEQLEPVSWTDWFASSGLPKSTFQNLVSELRQNGEILKENDVFTRS